MDPKTVETVAEGETRTFIKDINAFLGFANFYSRFILGYCRVVSLVTAVTRKRVSINWSKEAEEIFQNLRTVFITALVLRLFDPDCH